MHELFSVMLSISVWLTYFFNIDPADEMYERGFLVVELSKIFEDVFGKGA